MMLHDPDWTNLFSYFFVEHVVVSCNHEKGTWTDTPKFGGLRLFLYISVPNWNWIRQRIELQQPSRQDLFAGLLLAKRLSGFGTQTEKFGPSFWSLNALCGR